jgi:hypothetical protein
VEEVLETPELQQAASASLCVDHLVRVETTYKEEAAIIERHSASHGMSDVFILKCSVLSQ